MLVPKVRAGKAAGLLCAELGVAADGGWGLDGIASAGTPVIRKAISTATSCGHLRAAATQPV